MKPVVVSSWQQWSDASGSGQRYSTFQPCCTPQDACVPSTKVAVDHRLTDLSRHADPGLVSQFGTIADSTCTDPIKLATIWAANWRPFFSIILSDLLRYDAQPYESPSWYTSKGPPLPSPCPGCRPSPPLDNVDLATPNLQQLSDSQTMSVYYDSWPAMLDTTHK